MHKAQFLIERSLSKRVLGITPVGGGSISTAVKASLEGGETVFAKLSPPEKKMFPAEANGLRELSKAGVMRVPGVVFCSEEVLILDYIPSATPSNRKAFFEEFGRRFAALHRHSSDTFGFGEDNFIGSTPQMNLPPASSWRDFFRTHRLERQFRLADHNGYVDAGLRALYRRLEGRLDDLIPDDGEPPSLLHGDLWAGNYLCDDRMAPVLLDPAVYYGHREADLAMTLLFGGFDGPFYSSYREAWPLRSGWELRMELYKLYHLLNHLNLFGREYYGQVMNVMTGLCR